MGILSSTVTYGAPQFDGRVYVTEQQHMAADGREFQFEYLADDGADTILILQQRVVELDRLLEQQAMAMQVVQGTCLPLTVYQFLSRMTPTERVGIRTAAKTNPIIEDFMDLLKRSGSVYPTNPDVQMGLQYLVSQDKLTPERALIIGAE